MRFTSGAFVPLSLMLLLSSPLAGIAKSDAKASARAETRAEKSPPRSDGPQAGASTGIAITVYNQNFGLVKDIRSVDLKEGINNLRFDDVAAAIDPTTVSFTSLTAPNSVVVREQNYQYDLMDVGTILSKSVGKDIKIRQYLSGGAVHEITGTLLNPPLVTISDSNGNVSQRSQSIVLKTSSGVVVGAQGEVELAELPEGLVPKPSLLWKLAADKAGTHKAEISYQTQGMNWKCDYVAVANADDSACDLTSWVTLDNKSGTSYKQAALKLMAGDVHKVQNAVPRSSGIMYKSIAMNGAAAPQFSEQSFAEYHLYSLAGKTDVNNNETKQLTLFNAASVPVKKLYVFDSASPVGYYGRGGQEKQKVNVKLEVSNSKENNLGMPMPKGKVRVYKRDQDGAMQFVGEDLIDHTPKDEKVRLYIGDAFDLVGERKQTSYQHPSQRIQKQSFELTLRNHKEKEVTITCVEHAYGDWKVLNPSQPYTKKDSHTFEFNVKVPANGESKVTYDLEIRY